MPVPLLGVGRVLLPFIGRPPGGRTGTFGVLFAGLLRLAALLLATWLAVVIGGSLPCCPLVWD